jgi:hypothetical protein
MALHGQRFAGGDESAAFAAPAGFDQCAAAAVVDDELVAEYLGDLALGGRVDASTRRRRAMVLACRLPPNLPNSMAEALNCRARRTAGAGHPAAKPVIFKARIAGSAFALPAPR